MNHLSNHHKNKDQQVSSNTRIQKLEKILEASKVIHTVLNLDDLLHTVLEKSIESIGAERGTIYLVNHDEETFWSKVHTGDRKMSITLPLGVGVAGQVVKTGKTINVKNVKTDNRFYGEIDELTGFETRNMLCMPLMNRYGDILGALQLLNKLHEPYFLEEDEEFIEAFSIHAAIAIEKARLYEVEKQKTDIEKELFAAGEVQKKLFPSAIPQVDGYKFAAVNIPAAVTSGDLFDYIQLSDGKTLFTLGDVSGKGLPAAMIMANLQSLIRALPNFNPSVSYCLQQANKIIEKATANGKFITLFLGVLDPINHTISYSNAGHENPVLIKNRNISRLNEGGLPLGIFEDSNYEEVEITMEPGDMIVIFSDGVSDASNDMGDFFSEDRLIDMIRENRKLEPEPLIQLICKSIEDFVENTPQFDDITLSIVKRNET